LQGPVSFGDQGIRVPPNLTIFQYRNVTNCKYVNYMTHYLHDSS